MSSAQPSSVVDVEREAAAARVADFLAAREALGHSADLLGMVRRGGDEAATLRLSDLHLLAGSTPRA